MKKKLLIILGFLLAINLSEVLAQIEIEEKATNSFNEVQGKHKIDARELLENFDKANNIDYSKIGVPKISLKKTAWNFAVGTQKLWKAQDLSTEKFYDVPSTCRMVGTHCYIFVEDSIWGSKVSQEAVNAVAEAFDSKTPADPNKGIYQTDVDVFGNPPNVDGDDKIIILMLDIRDNYYVTKSGYIGGYFHSINEYSKVQFAESNEAEIYYLDAVQNNVLTPEGLQDAMSTTAHEFQHMIHFNYFETKGSVDETFLNESFSLAAEIINGYPIYSQSRYAGEPNQYLFEWRSGTDNVYTDYSRAARFGLYLYEQFYKTYINQNGGNFFKEYLQAHISGIDGLNIALGKIGTTRRFSSDVTKDILTDWFIANYLNDTSYNSKYGYNYTNLPQVSSQVYNTTLASSSDAIYKMGAKYISFKGGNNLSITFTNKSSALLKIKVIKIGNSVTEVSDVNFGTSYDIPDFGTAYSNVTFIIYQNSATYPSDKGPFQFSFTTAGYSGNVPKDTTYADSYKLFILKNTYETNYVTGTNSLKTKGLYEKFSIDGSAPIKELYYYFGDKVVKNSADAINFVIRSATSTGTPNNILFKKTLTTQDLLLPIDNGSNSIVQKTIIDVIPEVNVSNTFFAGLEWDAGMDDEFALFSDDPTKSEGQGMNRAWYWKSNGAFEPITVTFGNGFDADLAIGVKFNVTTAIKEDVISMPSTYSLDQNYPNPFNPSTMINYTLPKSGNVQIKIFDSLGREVRSLINEEKNAGKYNVMWDARDDYGRKISSGIYFYTITSGDFVQTKKMVLMK